MSEKSCGTCKFNRNNSCKLVYWAKNNKEPAPDCFPPRYDHWESMNECDEPGCEGVRGNRIRFCIKHGTPIEEPRAEGSEGENCKWVGCQTPAGIATLGFCDSHYEHTTTAGRNDDPVNSPAHYTSGEVQCIDAIRKILTAEEFHGFCLGNQLKYRWRAGEKGPAKQDLEKAEWYQRFLNGDDPREGSGG